MFLNTFRRRILDFFIHIVSACDSRWSFAERWSSRSEKISRSCQSSNPKSSQSPEGLVSHRWSSSDANHARKQCLSGVVYNNTLLPHLFFLFVMYTLISARHRRCSSIIPSREALLIDEQFRRRRRSLVDAVAARRLPLLIASTDANMLLLLLVWRTAKVRAAEHWLAKRIQLLTFVDATIWRVLLLRLMMVIGDG